MLSYGQEISSANMIERVELQVRGIVQGVGFRPFVYGLARRHSLAGRVCNNESGVLIEVEGDPDAIDRFVAELESNPPQLSQIDSLQRSEARATAHYVDFQILASADDGQKRIPISPDIATCADCRRELFDPNDRRWRYPFINCANCGPRFTIIEDVPYDRAKTTMRKFAMCAACRAEYEDPYNRRFHAEPVACPQCGPNIFLFETESTNAPVAIGEEALAKTISLLESGRILAIKGIGGFHLACNALNAGAVNELRQRKYREDKPFALMAASIDAIRKYCEVSDSEEELLCSAARPIVLLDRKAQAQIPAAVAPGVKTLGFMLPYTPLHYLLFENSDRPLVMTSANISDEPICYEDDEARQRLANIADYYLLHDRRIHMRTDDSVARVVVDLRSGQDARAPGSMILRRSRGYAPAPIKTGLTFTREILACGAELKNTFCLARDKDALVSHHIGDLENLETLRSFTEGIEHFKKLFYLEPEVVAYDLHPEYLSTKYALSVDHIDQKIGVQHHHAHIASCLADNQIDGEVIGVAMDGLGFGTDARMWGGEFFVAGYAAAERVAHLGYLPMPGGAKAIREPWRMAAVYLQQTFGDAFLDLDLTFVKEMDANKWKTLRKMTLSGSNSPATSSMGRLFDAISSLLRLRDATNYEGQAAVELEQIVARDCVARYAFELPNDGIIRAQNVIRSAVEDLIDGAPREIISAKFHLSVVDLIASMAQRIRDERKLTRIALSGGVFQNVFLLTNVRRVLEAADFEVFTHRRVPTNDGGISLGQAAIANALMK
jgi:hydrogenase maturation protein HypF